MKTYKMKAGKYWVGDPCYVVPDKQWHDVCNLFIYEPIKKESGNFSTELDFDSRDGQLFFYQGVSFFICGTAHGDGCYPLASLKNGNKVIFELGVDAGLLSIIPMELIEKWCGDDKEHDRLGIVVEMKHDFTIRAEGGNFDFDGYNVVTDNDEEDIYDE